MPEYDSVALFLDFANTSQQLVLAYVSVISAFLVMSYFAAQKLDFWLMIIVLILFTAICLLLFVQMTLIRTDLTTLYQTIQSQKASVGLEWFGTSDVWVVRLLNFLHQFVTIGGYIGCLCFFFRQRNSEE